MELREKRRFLVSLNLEQTGGCKYFSFYLDARWWHSHGVQMTGDTWEAPWLVSGHMSSLARGWLLCHYEDPACHYPAQWHKHLKPQCTLDTQYPGLVTFCHATQSCRVKNINTVRMWQNLTSLDMRDFSCTTNERREDFIFSLWEAGGVAQDKESSCHKYSKRKHTDS